MATYDEAHTYVIPSKAIDDMELTISVTMTVDEWRNSMRSQYHSSQDTFKNLIASALGDVTRMSTATYEHKE